MISNCGPAEIRMHEIAFSPDHASGMGRQLLPEAGRQDIEAWRSEGRHIDFTPPDILALPKYSQSLDPYSYEQKFRLASWVIQVCDGSSQSSYEFTLDASPQDADPDELAIHQHLASGIQSHLAFLARERLSVLVTG